VFNWLDKRPEIQALWCLPLAAMEPVALALERRGRERKQKSYTKGKKKKRRVERKASNMGGQEKKEKQR